MVSLEQAVTTPFATRQLADRVVKVERPGARDLARGYDESVRGLCSRFVWTNRSKDSLAFDLKRDDNGSILAEFGYGVGGISALTGSPDGTST